MFIYILHFDEPLSHAQHYVGMTGNLKQRLTAHATGAAAKLTSVLAEQDRPWTLAGLFQTTATNARRVERELKKSKNVGRYCELCNPDAPAPPASKRYPLSEIPFKTRSTEINKTKPSERRILIREARDPIDEAFAASIQRKHKVELGFLNHSALLAARTNGHLYVAELNEESVGFCIWTNHVRVQEVTIHQCAMLDEARLMGIARRMILALGAMNPTSSLWCKVRVDLPANYFWEAIEFQKVRTVTHKTSTQELNQYFRPANQ